MASRSPIDQRAALFGKGLGKRNGSAGPDRDQLKKEQLSREAMERQNDQHLDELESRISQLKEITRGIHKEAKDSVGFLETMSQGFDKAGTMLQGTLGNMNTMMQSKSGSSTCLVCGFTFALLLIMWVLRHFSWSSSAPAVDQLSVTLAQNSTLRGAAAASR
eukprot:TRINITY_DN34390_c0_g1_i1.p1 TRINITY_DN34390_c0_g1~~TRINITY_DN34390_c0_g1_i1.p1  ORF type:complete len:162 (-),score=35.22 TRINITY_DN34390_c0_g1_i1:296-781(-)